MGLLDKYEKIIFDMDGVITSENGYWNCAALAVYELLYDKRYYGTRDLDTNWMYENVAQIRKNILCNDTTIAMFKNFGVNSNWDLAYLTLSGAIGLDTEDFNLVQEHYKEQNLNAPEIYDHAAKLYSRRFGSLDCTRLSPFWVNLQTVFDEWYYGDEYFKQCYKKEPVKKGKHSFMANEVPMHGIEKTKEFLNTLVNKGITVAVGTGRPDFEFWLPMKNCGLLEYFDKNSIVTHDHVMAAAEKTGLFLAKPNPYCFLKAAYGLDYPDEKIVSGDYDKKYLEKVLIVGDAGADILAAKAMNTDFAAVLTGVNGKASKKYFEELSSEYIFDDVLELVKEN